MVLVWERPTVRTQEGVPQSNMVKPIFAQVVVKSKKEGSGLSFSLSLSLSFLFLGKFLKSIKSICFNIFVISRFSVKSRQVIQHGETKICKVVVIKKKLFFNL